MSINRITSFGNSIIFRRTSTSKSFDSTCATKHEKEFLESKLCEFTIFIRIREITWKWAVEENKRFQKSKCHSLFSFPTNQRSTTFENISEVACNCWFILLIFRMIIPSAYLLRNKEILFIFILLSLLFFYFIFFPIHTWNFSFSFSFLYFNKPCPIKPPRVAEFLSPLPNHLLQSFKKLSLYFPFVPTQHPPHLSSGK